LPQGSQPRMLGHKRPVSTEDRPTAKKSRGRQPLARDANESRLSWAPKPPPKVSDRHVVNVAPRRGASTRAVTGEDGVERAAGRPLHLVAVLGAQRFEFPYDPRRRWFSPQAQSRADGRAAVGCAQLVRIPSS